MSFNVKTFVIWTSPIPFSQELGTSGNLDGQQRLIVKGRFLPKGFENVIRRYMNEYVLCASCKSPDTLLDRDAGA